MSGSNLGASGAVALAQALSAIGQAHDTTVHWSAAPDLNNEALSVRHGKVGPTNPSLRSSSSSEAHASALPPITTGEASAGGAGGGGMSMAMGRNTSDVSALAAASGRMTIQPDRPSNCESPSKSPTPFACEEPASVGSVAGGSRGRHHHQRPTSFDQGGFDNLNYYDFSGGSGVGGVGGMGEGGANSCR